MEKVVSRLFEHDTILCRDGPGVIGIDEAGRGPLAGPVVAAAVWLPKTFLTSEEAQRPLALLNDSKQLKAATRESLMAEIQTLGKTGYLHYAHAQSFVHEIDQHNILGATRLAMQRALESLHGTRLPALKHALILVDGRPLKPFPYTHTALVKGDGKSAAIALASIIAKVTRDQLMVDLDKRYPEYQFASHKGYGTQKHRQALKEYGLTPEHRHLFVKTVFEKMAQAELDFPQADRIT